MDPSAAVTELVWAGGRMAETSAGVSQRAQPIVAATMAAHASQIGALLMALKNGFFDGSLDTEVLHVASIAYVIDLSAFYSTGGCPGFER